MRNFDDLKIAVAGTEDSRQIFLGNGDGRVGFVVLQQYVVPRLVLLDELVLEKQSVLFSLDNGIFDVANLGYQYAGSGTLLCLDKIRRHAAFQFFCLTYVDDGTFIVEILV